MPFHDGMYLSDYLDAVNMKAYGIVPADEWVPELKRQKMMKSSPLL